MAKNVPIRRQCLTLTMLLLSSSAVASAAADDHHNNARRRGGKTGQGRAGQAPPQPGDLTTIDETNKLLVAGVEMPAKNYNGEDEEEELSQIRGMLYHYEPMLPPYNGQYWEEELPVPKPVPLPPSSSDIVQDYNSDDSTVTTNKDSGDDQAVGHDSAIETEGASEDDVSSTTVQEEDESQPAEDVPKDDADADSADDVVDAAMDEAAVDESTGAGADIADEQEQEEERNAAESVFDDDGADDFHSEDSNDDDDDDDDDDTEANSVDDIVAEEKGKVDVETEDKPTSSSLADDIVDAAKLLDEGAIEAIAEEMAEGVRETDVESPAAATMSEEESSAATDVDDLANDTISKVDEQPESPEKEEKMDGHKDDGEQISVSNSGSEDIVADEMEDGSLENVAELTLDQETDDATVQDESQPPTVSEVESPKASDNSYVTAGNSTMPQTDDGGSDSNTAPANATSLTDHNASAAKEPQEADGKTSEDNTSLTSDDVEDRRAANGLNAKEPVDNDDRSTETVGKDIEIDNPSVALKEATADSRRIAEEKGVPTNIENSDTPAASDFNATIDDSVLDGDAPAYDNDAGLNEEVSPGSIHNESMLVTQQDEEVTTPEVEKDHKSWRGVYERDLGEKETQKKHGETNNTADDNKRADIDSLDNVREYIASSGEEISGSMPSEAISSQENGVVADKGDVESEVLKDDTHEGISSSVDAKRGVEMNEGDHSEGMATESITATETMNDVTEEEPADNQVPSTSDEETVGLSSSVEAEESKEESIDLNDLPDISSLRSSFSSSDVNSNFIDGIDDLDKFLEEVDTPDELDVAHGSSMQEVLVGKGVQILVKKVNAVVRRVKFITSKVKYRIGNSLVAAKIREGIETSGIIALGEKVREASNISEHKEKVVSIGQKIGQVFDEKLDSMNKFFDDLMENDIAQSASKILERIKGNSVVRRIINTIGLSDEDDDDLMDFSSFTRMQQQGSGSGTEASLEDRLAAMKQMY